MIVEAAEELIKRSNDIVRGKSTAFNRLRGGQACEEVGRNEVIILVGLARHRKGIYNLSKRISRHRLSGHHAEIDRLPRAGADKFQHLCGPSAPGRKESVLPVCDFR